MTLSKVGEITDQEIRQAVKHATSQVYEPVVFTVGVA